MDNKNFDNLPEEDTSWLDELLASSDYGEDALSEARGAGDAFALPEELLAGRQPEREEVSSDSVDDAELEKIMQEALSDEWDLTETILQAPPIPIYDEEPVLDGEDFPGFEDPQEDSQPEEEVDPLRKVRPKRKNGYGLFGIPHLLSTAIWVFIVVAIGVSLGRLLWVCAADILAFGRTDQSVTITITDSDDAESVADKLYNAGLIRYRDLFVFYTKLLEDPEKGVTFRDRISSGTYELNTLFDYKALVSNMSATSSYRETKTVTIPEGYTCAQIFALLEKENICDAEELKAYRVQSDYWFLEGMDLSAEYPLEGFLYPDTYEFYVNGTAREVFSRFLSRFEDIIEGKLKDVALKDYVDKLNDRLGTEYTLYEVMIVASMIEKESASSSENYDVSSVIYNRLGNTSQFPFLNIDATIVYAQGGSAETIDKELDSPYNTYKYKGLPPTPICNPSLLSIQAALNPADTDYYYYALDPSTGLHHFSETYKEHQAFLNSLN